MDIKLLTVNMGKEKVIIQCLSKIGVYAQLHGRHNLARAALQSAALVTTDS
jgi:hypothetical protein